ncbi:hypothetical protein Cni_G28951 [Canna indica]|uniref:Preprotein translocase subunit SecE n=1 Tax=Canna indica TaxID=4628 RepID=A0AAQ3L400_9LILI|nr:hypothetical protein Cni_G28951 [Canna indica]
MSIGSFSIVDIAFQDRGVGSSGPFCLPLLDAQVCRQRILVLSARRSWRKFSLSRSLRSVAVFLAEQPSQLKYIEWPTFQSTLKTATLTLVLVALLIVALSSIDSCLYYVLALLLRKTA